MCSTNGTAPAMPLATGGPAADSTAGASSSSSTVTEGRAKRATAGAHAGWKHRLEEPAAEPVKASKKPKRDPNRVNPKAYTDMITLRKLRAKYSVDQLEWCNRRFPLALPDDGDDGQDAVADWLPGHYRPC